MTSLRVERRSSPEGVLLKLAGRIDETMTADQLQSTAAITVIDLDGVSLITSFGVREWLRSVELCRGYLGFVNCRPALVNQFNMVGRFSGRGQLLSFYAPYVCTSCNANFEVLLDVREHYSLLSGNQLPAQHCPQCQAEAELDDLPEALLSYITANPKPNPPRAVDVLLSGRAVMTAPVRDVFRVQQEVEERATVLWLSGPLDKHARLGRVTGGLEGAVLVVLQDVSRIDAQGGRALLELNSAAVTFLALLRVPEAVYASLPPQLAQRLPIASVMTRGWCGHCKDAFSVEHTGALTLCRTCGAALNLPEVNANTIFPPGLNSILAQRTGPREASKGSFLERFEIIKPIGSGGMAEVFLARMSSIGGFRKDVALKRIHSSLKRTAQTTAMFLAEAKLAARLNHPNIVQVFDIGVEAGDLYLAMEYVHGVDLRSALAAAAQLERPLTIAVALKIVSEVCGALAAAHGYIDAQGVARPIVHRDVSPPNTLLSSDGVVKLSDFGIAKVEGEGETTPASITKGKLTYLAPELIQRVDERADPRSDLFAAGVMLFQCLSGYHPFVRATRFGTLTAIMNDPLPPLAGTRAGLSPPLDEVLKRLCAKNPNDRFQTAIEAKHALDEVLQQTNEAQPTEALAQWVKTALTIRTVTIPSEATGTNRVSALFTDDSDTPPMRPPS